tara:strand:- start:1416 stop:1571 length:156 start_codon:yes stop_codon:yes gene_type:complete
MQKLLDKLKALRQRIANTERKTQRVLIGSKIFIVDEKGNHAKDLKEHWGIK